MHNEGLSALVLCQPESITYASGAFPGVASFWRRAGAAFLVVPADESAAITAIVGDLQAGAFTGASGLDDVRSHRIWVETDSFPLRDGKPRRTPRPAQYSLDDSLALLRDVLREKGLSGNIGLELGFVPAADFVRFQTLPVQWIDATRIVEKLRSIKNPAEIERLGRAARHAAAGLSRLMEEIAPGMSSADMSRVWQEAALQDAVAHGVTPPQSCWSYIAVGGDGFAPGSPAAPGDIIKMDVGCVIDGYSSDGARTAVLGTPTPAAQAIHDALQHAFEAGLSCCTPGRPLADIYRSISVSMWDQGYETYGRGHFGHGVGSSIWSEEWPFISSDADAVLEPGMVLALETPWYIDGLGGFIIEDQLLMTATGVEVMAPMSRSLRRL